MKQSQSIKAMEMILLQERLSRIPSKLSKASETIPRAYHSYMRMRQNFWNSMEEENLAYKNPDINTSGKTISQC